jgi:hypothetical protein
MVRKSRKLAPNMVDDAVHQGQNGSQQPDLSTVVLRVGQAGAKSGINNSSIRARATGQNNDGIGVPSHDNTRSCMVSVTMKVVRSVCADSQSTSVAGSHRTCHRRPLASALLPIRHRRAVNQPPAVARQHRALCCGGHGSGSTPSREPQTQTEKLRWKGVRGVMVIQPEGDAKAALTNESRCTVCQLLAKSIQTRNVIITGGLIFGGNCCYSVHAADDGPDQRAASASANARRTSGKMWPLTQRLIRGS